MNILVLVMLLASPVATLSAPRTARPPHYRLAANLDTKRHALSASVAIEIPPDQARSAGFLLGAGYRISAISAGAEADLKVDQVQEPFPAQRIVVHSKPGRRGSVTLKVDYAGDLGPTGDPPLNAISPERTELSADSLWYPMPEHIGTRFVMDALITGLASGVTVASPDRKSATTGGFQAASAKGRTRHCLRRRSRPSHRYARSSAVYRQGPRYAAGFELPDLRAEGARLPRELARLPARRQGDRNHRPAAQQERLLPTGVCRRRRYRRRPTRRSLGEGGLYRP